MSLVDHLLATRTPLELAQLAYATARDNALLRDRIHALEHELFWKTAAINVKETPP